MLEMLPTPWGLVRSGVAPDHPKIKSISAQFEKTALDPRFRFFGNIVVGDHVQAAELAERYDAVIYAVGAQSDRSLGIPGEDLPGSVAAVDFVGWYNAHPHFEEMAPDLSTGRAVVVGNGNVALDVARILVTDPDVLATTDIADHALKSLHDRGVEEVLIVGRRGPLQAPFTTLELRELGHLEGLGDVDVIVDPADFADISDEDVEAAGKTVRNNIKVLRGYAEREPRTAPSAASCSGSARRRSRSRARVKRRINRVGPQRAGRRQRPHRRQGHRRARGGARPTGGARRRLPRRADAGPAVRRSQRHDPAHQRPDRGPPQRVRRRLDQARAHRGDRQQQERLAGHRRHAARGSFGRGRWRTVDADYSEKLVEWLLERQPKLITDDHWKLINEHERAAGEPHGRPRVKLTSVAELLRIAHG